jgi:hypothetical protein
MILKFSRKEMHQPFIAQLLLPNASFKGDKTLEYTEKVNAPGLALCCRSSCFYTTDVKVEIVLHRRVLCRRDNFLFYYIIFFVFYTQ